MKRLLLALAFLLLLVFSAVGCQQELVEDTGPDPIELPELSPGVYMKAARMPSGTGVRYTISIPSGYDAATSVPLVVVLHYGGDVTAFYGRDMVDYFAAPALGELGAIIIAPDALEGGDWTTSRNEEAVVWLTKSALGSYAVDPDRVLITGYSMGGEGAWHIGGRNQDLFTAAIPVSGDPPRQSVSWSIPVYVIHSRHDEILPLEKTKAAVEKLRSEGASIELYIVDGLTHYDTAAFVKPLRRTVPWLQAHWSK
jgi:predicted peptidase